MYQRYFETSIELVKSGLYDGLAHPDSIKLFGHVPSFSLFQYYEELAKALKAQNMYIEQNSGVCRRCPDTAELGINQDMLRCMKQHNIKIITVSDAHCPEDVGSKISELINLIEKHKNRV